MTEEAEVWKAPAGVRARRMLASLGGAALLLSAIGVNQSLSLRGRRADACGQPFEACLESACCANEHAWSCMKRVGKPFAQCRRPTKDENNQCVGDASWQCPGWEDCTTESYGNCWDSGCCLEKNQACFKKVGRNFAQVSQPEQIRTSLSPCNA